MNRQFQKLKTFAGLAILSASISVGLAGCPQTQSGNNGYLNNGTTKTEKVVKVDVNMPMTGNLGIYGTSVRHGAMLATEDIKNDDSNPIKLVFDWQDNAGNQATTVSIFQKQFLEKPDIYVSGLPLQNL
ncbi:MAG: ABC transporter substrate-binding protein, partial [Dolichospermum sp.]